jgi:hypothetical protein
LGWGRQSRKGERERVAVGEIGQKRKGEGIRGREGQERVEKDGWVGVGSEEKGRGRGESSRW